MFRGNGTRNRELGTQTMSNHQWKATTTKLSEKSQIQKNSLNQSKCKQHLTFPIFKRSSLVALVILVVNGNNSMHDISISLRSSS